MMTLSQVFCSACSGSDFMRSASSAGSVARVNDYRQLLTLLDKGRVEVAVLDRVMGGWEPRQLGFDLTYGAADRRQAKLYLFAQAACRADASSGTRHRRNGK